VWQTFLKGGPVMWPLLACSVIALAIILERLIFLKRGKQDPAGFLRRLVWAMGQGRWVEASSQADQPKTSVEKVIATGYTVFLNETNGNWQFGDPNPYQEEILGRVEEAMEARGRIEVDEMRQNLSILDVIITISPMLGLLGTVTGIIKSFNVINALAGASDPLKLSVGIAEALITTAAGLIVAIPALLCTTYINGLIERNVSQMNRWGDEFLRLLRTKRGDGYEHPGTPKTAATRDY